MRLRVVNTEDEFSVQVTDDQHVGLIDDDGNLVSCGIYQDIHAFCKYGKRYVVLGPYWGLSNVFKIYELTEVPVPVDE